MTQGNPNVNVNIETQTGNKPSADYSYTTVGSKSTETDSERYQLVGCYQEAVQLLKAELKDKQTAINDFIDIIRNSW